MNSLSSDKTKQTGMVFRVLAGILAAFLLLIGLPLALSGAFTETWWESAFWAVGSVVLG